MATLGERIRQRREQLGLTQTELARRAGVNQPTLQRLESGGTAAPSASLVAALSAALGMSVDGLLLDHRRADAVIDLDDGTTLVIELKRVGRGPATADAQLREYAQRIGTALDATSVAIHKPDPTPPDRSDDASESRSAVALAATNQDLEALAAEVKLLRERVDRLEAPRRARRNAAG